MNSTKIIRLYRAISNRELTQEITSINTDISTINLADEIYSHVVSTYKLRIGSLYSFTDDFSVAKKYLNKSPNEYIGIGYVDISICEATGAFICPSFIKKLVRISTPEDWLDIIEQTNESEPIQNLNYKSAPIVNFVKLFVPCQKSVVSWSKNSSEYVAVLDGLKLTIVNDKYIAHAQNSYHKSLNKNRKLFENYDKYILGLEQLELKNIHLKKIVTQYLKNYKHLCSNDGSKPSPEKERMNAI